MEVACWKLNRVGGCIFAEIKTTETVGPVLLHVVTEKGRGYLPAESASDKMHGVVQYDTVTGKQLKAKSQVGPLALRCLSFRFSISKIVLPNLADAVPHQLLC